jgi:flap endonuclease-1
VNSIAARPGADRAYIPDGPARFAAPSAVRGSPSPKYSASLDADVGLPLRPLVTAQELAWEALAGRTLAVDGYNAVYQFLATIRQRDGQLFTDAEGRVTSHLMGTFYRTTSLLGQGVLPVWVFDGRPPERKAATIRKRIAAKEKAEAAWAEALAAGDLETARRKAAQTSHLTRPMVDELHALLRGLGVPVVLAPGEGEAEAAVLAARGATWASASEDYDSLLFGTPRLVRGLAARARGGAAPGAQLIDRAELLATLGIDQDELIALGVIVGTDFNDGAAGYGPKKALKLVREHLGFDRSVEKAGLDVGEARAVAEIFRHPPTREAASLAFGPVDEDGLRRLLVETHGFSETRVRAAIARARSRPPVATSPAEARARQTLLETFGGDPA